MGNKITVGFLVLLLFSTGLYITFNDQLRLRVDEDKSTFYVQENSRWVVSGREYNRMFDGSTQMNRRASQIKVETFYDNDEIVKIVRTTPYIRGPVIVDTYTFDGKVTDITLFPISHQIEIHNGSGYFYRYSVDELVDVPPKKKLVDGETVHSFGRNMKVEWSPGYNWAWLGWPYGSDSMAVQYKLKSDYETFNARLFDPPDPGICNYDLICDTGETNESCTTDCV
jgi:hypothetical protein